MVNAALAQLGKKNADFDGMPKDDWCAYFMDWVSMASGAGSAGLLPNKYSGYGKTRAFAQFAVSRGTGTLTCFSSSTYNTMYSYVGDTNSLVKSTRVSYTPAAGDFIFFTWSNSTASFASHVGLVYKVSGSTVYYVDGNGSAVRGDTAFYTRSYVDTHTILESNSQIVAYLRLETGSVGDSGAIYVPSDVTISGSGVSSLTKTSVRLNGSCLYTGTKPSSVGVYFGTSKTNMSVKDSDTISHSKNPFDIWYDISGLKAGTTYYWQLYAVVNGKTIKESTIHSFTTLADSTALSVTSTTNCLYYVTVPANYRLQGYETPTSTTNYRCIEASSSGYLLSCKQKIVRSDGSIRYSYTDSNGYTIYFNYASSMDVTVMHNYTYTGVEAAHPHATYSQCTCGYIYTSSSTNYDGSCIICNPPIVSVTGVNLDQTAITLIAGNHAALSATVLPEDATNDSISWNSSNTSVASVDASGNVQALSPGTATITVRTNDGGKTASCTVTVCATFPDVPANTWYYEGVTFAVEQGLMYGTGHGYFSPMDDLTRAQLVTILYRLADEPAISGTAAFSDVPAGTWYTNAVVWAASKGIVAGYPDGTFLPDKAIVREEIASVLYRYTEDHAVAGDYLSQFPDQHNLHSYARDAVNWTVANGLIAGTENTATGVVSLKPQDTADRAQIATIIMRFTRL